MAGLDRHPDWFGQLREGIPDPVVSPQGRGKQRFIRPHGDGILLHILSADVYRRAHGQTQPLALPQGVAHRAPVPADHMTAFVQKIPGGVVLTCVAFQKCRVVAVRDEADVLRVVFPGVDEAVFLRDGAHLLLGQAAQGELNPGKLLLIQTGEKIGLILGLVRRLI